MLKANLSRLSVQPFVKSLKVNLSNLLFTNLIYRWENISSAPTIMAFINERWSKVKLAVIGERPYRDAAPIYFKEFIKGKSTVERGPVNGQSVQLVFPSKQGKAAKERQMPIEEYQQANQRVLRRTKLNPVK